MSALPPGCPFINQIPAQTNVRISIKYLVICWTVIQDLLHLLPLALLAGFFFAALLNVDTWNNGKHF